MKKLFVSPQDDVHKPETGTRRKLAFTQPSTSTQVPKPVPAVLTRAQAQRLKDAELEQKRLAEAQRAKIAEEARAKLRPRKNP
jgi:hypothetical protein